MSSKSNINWKVVRFEPKKINIENLLHAQTDIDISICIEWVDG